MAAPILKLFGVGKDLVTSQMSQERGTQSVNTTISDGQLIENVDLTTTATTVPHALGRVPKGYIVVGSSDIAAVYHETPHARASISLRASATTTVSLWVF